MKYLGLTAVLFSTTLAGIYLFELSKKRVKICRELIMFCDSLKRDLMYWQTPVNLLLGEIIDGSNLDTLKFISADAITENTEVNSPLESAANKELESFLHLLGTSDTDTQLELVLSFKEYVQGLLDKYTENHNKNAKLYLSFGFFSGCVLLIMFI